jgi:hypothetical protein
MTPPRTTREWEERIDGNGLAEALRSIADKVHDKDVKYLKTEFVEEGDRARSIRVKVVEQE